MTISDEPIKNFLPTIHALAISLSSDKGKHFSVDSVGFLPDLKPTFPFQEGCLLGALPSHIISQAYQSKSLVCSHLFVVAGLAGPLPDHLGFASLADENSSMNALLMLIHHRLIRTWVYGSLNSLPKYTEKKAASGLWQKRLENLGDARITTLPRQDFKSLSTALSTRTTAATLVKEVGQLLESYLKRTVPVLLHPLMGGLTPLSEDSLSFLGQKRLGIDALLGSSLSSPSSKWTLEIGPLSEELWSILGDHDYLKSRTRSLIENISLIAQEWEIWLILRPNVARPFRVESKCSYHALGRNSFLGRQRRACKILWQASA